MVGLTAATAGVSYFSGSSNPSATTWLLGLILTTGGAALGAGFLTPFAGLLVGICFLGIGLSWFPTPSWSLHDARQVAIGLILTAAAIGLLGPGAYSVDGRMFGRREIVIPPAPRAPES